jgi:hypothetical protein
LLPDTLISVPRLQWADVHLRYRAQRIQGRSVPLEAWVRKCHSQVTPEIDRALIVKGFLVLGVTLI